MLSAGGVAPAVSVAGAVAAALAAGTTARKNPGSGKAVAIAHDERRGLQTNQEQRPSDNTAARGEWHWLELAIMWRGSVIDCRGGLARAV
jgi:hypothetical protein